MDIDEYFEQGTFDGTIEVTKGRQIDEFFAEKYRRVNDYFNKVDRETDKAATRARSSIRSYAPKLLTQ